MLSTFEEYLPFSGNDVNQNDIQEFMEMLVKARLALDICFVRPTEYGYSLDMALDEDNEDLKKLMMLESMLYVSSSNYTNHRWFNWLMDQLENGIPNVKDMYKSLKSFINNTFALPTYEALNYTGDNRFWFWLLDFYISSINPDHILSMHCEWRYGFSEVRERAPLPMIAVKI